MRGRLRAWLRRPGVEPQLGEARWFYGQRYVLAEITSMRGTDQCELHLTYRIEATEPPPGVLVFAPRNPVPDSQ